MATHRFTVITKSNPAGDDVGAEDGTILPSGALAFVIDGRIQVAYAANEWTLFEYAYQEDE